MMFILPAFLLILISVPTLSGILSDWAWDKVVVDFPCETHFIRFAVMEPTVCRNSSLTGRQGRLSCLEGGLLQNDISRQKEKAFFLDKPLATDNRLVITGTPLRDTVMEVLLISRGDYVLCLAVRFNHGNLFKRVLLNSRIGGQWGASVDTGSFPYAVSVQFNTTIVAKASEYQIFVNGALMHSFDFRDPAPTVTKILIWGDLLVRSFLVD